MLLISIGFALFPLAFLDLFIRKKLKKAIIIIIVCYFIFLGGFRWMTGTDWYAYYYAFVFSDTYYGAVQAPLSFEWGYGMLNYIVNNLGGNYTIFLLIFTYLKISLKYKVFVSENFMRFALFSFFLFYCYEVGAIYGTRQNLAVSISFFSLLAIQKKRRFYFYVLVFIAMLIHRSAIIFVLAYDIYYYKSSQKKLLLAFLGSILLYFILLNTKLIEVVNQIPVISSIEKYQNKISTYAELGQISYGNADTKITNILGVMKKVAVMLPLILTFNYQQRTLRPFDFAVYKGLLNLISFGSLLYFTMGAFASDFKRINSYFDIFEILIIPLLVYNVKNKKLILPFILYFGAIALSKLYSSVMIFEDLLDPFYFIFDEPFDRYIY